jgi:hypothetical protein
MIRNNFNNSTHIPDVYNVNNYSVDELLTLLNIDTSYDYIDKNEIIDKSNEKIEEAKENKNKQEVIFYRQIKNLLLDYLENQNENDEDNVEEDIDNTFASQQTNNWIKNEYIKQNDKNQNEKITDRYQKIDVYENGHFPMNKEQLGVTNTVDVKVAQDVLNPKLENTIMRLVNLDSQFRQASNGISTDYTLDLSDTLLDVLNIRLYSIQIPYTWYTIDYGNGNSCYWLFNLGVGYQIYIKEGNYTTSQFVIEFNLAIIRSGFTNPLNITVCEYNENNGKVTLNLDGLVDPNNNIIEAITSIDEFNEVINPYIIWYDISGTYNCKTNNNQCNTGEQSNNQSNVFSNTLGWLMGYRNPVMCLLLDGNEGEATLNLFGSKYFILVIEDYLQNHVNNEIVAITELGSSLSLPTYYSGLQPYICQKIRNAKEISINEMVRMSSSNSGNILTIHEKALLGNRSIKEVLPSAPRTLTKSQIYSINEIMKNREKNTKLRDNAPVVSDTFALIPIKYGGMKTGEIYVDFSGSLQDHKRDYFGPVNMSRLRVKLLDDKGRLVNLHGGDWNVTFICECLYQY